MMERIQFLKRQMEEISDDGVFFERMTLLLEAEAQHRNA